MPKFIFIFLLLIAGRMLSQTKVTLPELNMEYELPAKWETKSFFKLDWESPGGNNLCPCAGVLNSFKIPGGGDFDYMYFSAYPSDRRHANAEKRQGVWQYKFVQTEKTDSVKTDFLVWERQVSKLKPFGSSDNRFKDFTAYRLNTHFGATYFVVYIWAKPYMLQQYKSQLDAIIASFKAIK